MFDKLFEGIIEKLQNYGVHSILLLILILIVQHPERAEKLKLIIVTPFFKLFKWFGRAYVKHSLSTRLNNFFEKSVSDISNCGKKREIRFSVDLIKDKNDIIKKNGQLIIRFTENDDQSQNLLTAAKIALPEVVCPYMRPNIDKHVNSAIDLTFLKKLADNIDNHAKLVFRRHFLEPTIAEDPKVHEIFKELVLLDRKGVFVSIFINELNYVGEGIYGDADSLNRTDEVIRFLKFLLDIANRDKGDINELNYQSTVFAIGVILLARTDYAHTQGIAPYIKRLQKKFSEGCKSVYIVAFPKSWDFFSRLNNAINVDNRFEKPNIYKLTEKNRTLEHDALKISLIRNNKLFIDSSFESNISQSKIEIGTTVIGNIIDISVDAAIVEFRSLTGIIKRSEVSWNSCIDCRNIFNLNSEYEFLIKEIDTSTGTIELTRKFADIDPWKLAEIPVEGEVISVIPMERIGMFIICMFGDKLEVRLPIDEISWTDMSDDEINLEIGEFIDVKVTFIDNNARIIRVSKRATIENPWSILKRRFPEGTSRIGVVKKIEQNIVVVEIESGIFGRLSDSSFRMAGYEYQNFQENLILGQKLEVVVTKVWEGKQKISLELKRNYDRIYPQRKIIN
jgi:predicted RNA-binding protein with RPS1 domain